MEIFEFLENSKIIHSFELIDFKRWEDGQYLNIKIEFIDQSLLFVKEFYDRLSRNYSYHWQDKNNQLIIRWDNAPHYPEHVSFPHHKHVAGKLTESEEISLDDVLKVIEKELKRHKKQYKRKEKNE